MQLFQTCFPNERKTLQEELLLTVKSTNCLYLLCVVDCKAQSNNKRKHALTWFQFLAKMHITNNKRFKIATKVVLFCTAFYSMYIVAHTIF
jgi:hypothetical protein